jgi:hypothetical protein
VPASEKGAVKELVKVKFGTRLEPDLQHRLKVHAALVGRTLEDVVSEALNGYLSAAASPDSPLRTSGPRATTMRPRRGNAGAA